MKILNLPFKERIIKVLHWILKTFSYNFFISPKAGCQSDRSCEVSYFKYEFFMVWSTYVGRKLRKRQVGFSALKQE